MASLAKGEKFGTPVGIMNYPKIWVAQHFKDAKPDDPKKFSMELIFMENDPAIEMVKAHHAKVKAEGFPQGMAASKNGFEAFKVGRLERPDQPWFADKVYLSMTQYEDKPLQVLDTQQPDPQPILDKSLVYAGANCRVVMHFHAYDGGSGGIGANFHVVQLTGGGDVLESADHTDVRDYFGAGDTPPVSAPPVSAPPVSAPLVSAPPVSAPPVSAPPVSAPPVSAVPAGFVMNPAVAGTNTYQSYLDGGWTWEQMVETKTVIAG